MDFIGQKCLRDVNRFVKSCMTCQQTKSLTKRTQDLLEPLPILRIDHQLVLDFITGLPTTVLVDVILSW